MVPKPAFGWVRYSVPHGISVRGLSFPGLVTGNRQWINRVQVRATLRAYLHSAKYVLDVQVPLNLSVWRLIVNGTRRLSKYSTVACVYLLFIAYLTLIRLHRLIPSLKYGHSTVQIPENLSWRPLVEVPKVSCGASTRLAISGKDLYRRIAHLPADHPAD